jgi:hypothetical protein
MGSRDERGVDVSRAGYVLSFAVALGVALAVLAIIEVRSDERRVQAEAEATQAKAARLDRYCALLRITTQAVHDDAASTDADMAGVAVRMWNTLAAIDHRALTPCLHESAPGYYGPPDIHPCADGDVACVRRNSSDALANFEAP